MKKIFFILVPFSLGYLITCIFRSINAVQGIYLQKELGFSLYQIGVITSVFFLTFCFGQIPLGIYLDRYGARKVQSVFFLIAAAGTFMFAFTGNYYILILSRLIIGFGICGGLMSAFKANVENYPATKVALMNSIVLVSGGIGIIIAGKPAEMIMTEYGWRTFNIFIAIILVITSGLIFFFYKEEEKQLLEKTTIKNEFKKIFSFCTDKEIILLALVSVVPLAYFMALQGLWITPILQNVNGMSFNDAAIFISILGGFMTAGLLLSGFAGHYLQNKYGSMHKVLFVSTVISLIFLILIVLNIPYVSVWSWMPYALIVQAGTLGYAQVAVTAGKERAGKAITMFNVFLFVLSFIFQYLYGWILNICNNLQIFDRSSQYQLITALFIIFQFISLVIFKFKEKDQFNNAKTSTSTI